jgi:hypothetical protein
MCHYAWPKHYILLDVFYSPTGNETNNRDFSDSHTTWDPAIGDFMVDSFSSSIMPGPWVSLSRFPWFSLYGHSLHYSFNIISPHDRKVERVEGMRGSSIHPPPFFLIMWVNLSRTPPCSLHSVCHWCEISHMLTFKPTTGKGESDFCD